MEGRLRLQRFQSEGWEEGKYEGGRRREGRRGEGCGGEKTKVGKEDNDA